MLAALLETVIELVAGWLPRRQPWRALVTFVYVLAALAGLTLLALAVAGID